MGNICRSPLLEGWARHLLDSAGAAEVANLDSAGTGDWHAGQPPDRRAIAAAQRRGIDISRQRARVLVPADFRRFDLILCADRDNLAWLKGRAPTGHGARIDLVLDWCGVEAGAEVPDPYQGTTADFDHVCELARAAADGLLRKLRPQA